MLNKLLKRCMPWMDKGRWYRCSIRKSKYGDPVFMLPPGWTGIRISGQNHWMIATNIKLAHILDSKLRMYGTFEEDTIIPDTNSILSIAIEDGYVAFDIDYDVGINGDIECTFDVFIEVI